MKALCIVLMLLPLYHAMTQTDPCSCTPSVGSIRPYRLPAKWETLGHTYPKGKKSLKPSTIHSWETKYSAKANSTTVAWNTTRLVATPEESLYTLKGYLWYVKKEVDCDYHIQIGKKSKGAAKRAVVELTIKQCTIQKTLLDTLQGRGYTLTQIRNGVELTKGIQVTIQGLGFYDWQHQLKEPNDNTDADSPLWKQEGTAWELHPVISFEFD